MKLGVSFAVYDYQDDLRIAFQDDVGIAPCRNPVTESVARKQ